MQVTFKFPEDDDFCPPAPQYPHLESATIFEQETFDQCNLSSLPTKIMQGNPASATTTYHIGVEGRSDPLVIQVIPVYWAEEHMILYLQL